MSVRSVLAAGRRAARRILVDECAVFRKIGTTTDPNTGAVVDEFATVYVGPSRVRMESSWATDQEAGQQVVTVGRYLVEVLFEAVGIEVNDFIEFTASKDPDLVNRRLAVSGPFGGTHATMRRYICEEAA